MCYKESSKAVLINFLGVCNLPNLRGIKVLLIPLARDTQDSELEGSVREKWKWWTGQARIWFAYGII